MPELTLGTSKLEKLAAEALTRDALGGFNLLTARQTLSQLLNAIGRTVEFATYTKHDITHIDALLTAADWIIPQKTFEKLSVADALVITLSIYVHDLGMLVTRDEYDQRHDSGFPAFKEEILEDTSDRGIDLKDRLKALDPSDHEHFLYEEFVRVHHAERVEAWITGEPHTLYGVSTEAASIITKTFEPLGAVLRNDIAMVARSHHQDDLDDLGKYKVSRKYGSESIDTANLQYAAIVLRTADLLHMTQDRTPTIQFRLASPSDPLGQREWQKQRSVRAVAERPSAGEQSQIIEVHATFENAEGFFSLMEYLDYCESQLRLSSSWASLTSTTHPYLDHYIFPWTAIDRDQVEAAGFDRRQFLFSFDQEKVLELLTGHTLYNDASVAVRELVQNSIDAVRLSGSAKVATKNENQPDILITYDSKSRTLRVLDHGVGMTQRTIEDHFLKVGSSSYQTKEFKENHPAFTSISRFGIGVLSAFMIADEVRVATITDGELKGRELVLKSVHGRYLIKNFDRNSEYYRRIGSHGTEIELKLRASTDLEYSVLDLMRRWIVLPGCQVECRIDDDEQVSIGAQSVEEALEHLLERLPIRVGEKRIHKYESNGASIAIAQTWNPTYKEWEVLRFGRNRHNIDELRVGLTNGTPFWLSGVSVQGVRVTESVPGFDESGPIMLIDVTGPTAPKTNVARTDLEAGTALDGLTRTIYTALVDAITEQVKELTEKISQRLALKEATHLYRDATAGDSGYAYTKPKLLRQVLRSAELQPVEISGDLQAKSCEDLEATGLAVLVGPAASDAARFLDWLPKPKGLLTLLQEGGLLKEVNKASMPLLGGQAALFSYDELLWNAFEPVSITSFERGSSLLFNMEAECGRWSSDRQYLTEMLPTYRKLREELERPRDRYYGNAGFQFTNRYCLDDTVEFSGLEDKEVIFVGDKRLFMPGSKFSELFGRLKSRIDSEADTSAAGEMATLLTITDWITSWPMPSEFHKKMLEPLEAWLADDSRSEWIELSSLEEAARSILNVKAWTANSAWQRRGDEQPR